ncbi:MAG TPA: hypothetical protein VE309_04305, partial [Caulobacteraceae bacterium]|nr:hypothetical protein [Caulobacteraceae bacterium]
MKRGLKSDELALWGHVAATVRPLGARRLPGKAYPAPAGPLIPPQPAGATGSPPKTLDPRLARRLARERDLVSGRLD